MEITEHHHPTGDIRLDISIERRPGVPSPEEWEAYLPDPIVTED